MAYGGRRTPSISMNLAHGRGVSLAAGSTGMTRVRTLHERAKAQSTEEAAGQSSHERCVCVPLHGYG